MLAGQVSDTYKHAIANEKHCLGINHLQNSMSLLLHMTNLTPTGTYLHDTDPIGDIRELGVSSPTTLVEYEGVQGVTQANCNVQRAEHEHQSDHNDERPVVALLLACASPEECA
jgi:hypothetical protein